MTEEAASAQVPRRPGQSRFAGTPRQLVKADQDPAWRREVGGAGGRLLQQARQIGLLAALTAGGRLVIIEYRPKPMSERPCGSPPEQQFPREQLDREKDAAGFRVSQAFESLPEQFFVIYVPR